MARWREALRVRLERRTRVAIGAGREASYTDVYLLYGFLCEYGRLVATQERGKSSLPFSCSHEYRGVVDGLEGYNTNTEAISHTDF